MAYAINVDLYAKKIAKLKITEKDLYNGGPRDPEKIEKQMQAFLLAYLKYGVQGKAAAQAGTRARVIGTWCQNVPKFEELYREIEEDFTDNLEVEANSRALEKSDTLLQFLLKARRPEKFNPTQNIKATIGGEGIKLVFSDSELSPEEKELLLAQTAQTTQTKDLPQNQQTFPVGLEGQWTGVDSDDDTDDETNYDNEEE